jgi:hypothetical protein
VRSLPARTHRSMAMRAVVSAGVTPDMLSVREGREESGEERV